MSGQRKNTDKGRSAASGMIQKVIRRKLHG